MAYNNGSNSNGGAPAYDPSRALAPAQQTALASLADEPARKAAQLYKALLPGGDKLTEVEALAGAMYARATGLDPIRGEFYIVHGIGVAPGYKGEQIRKAQKTHFHYRFRPMNPSEREWHELDPKDIGVICVFIDLDLAQEMRRLNIEYTPTEGIGVLRDEERYNTEEWRDNGPNTKRYKAKLPRDKWTPADPPKGRTWTWKAEQRALKDALNHTPGFEHMAQELEETADEILLRGEADIAGFERPPAAARLDNEQARAWVDKQARSAEMRSHPEEMRAEGAKLNERSALLKEWNIFNDADGRSACPYCGTNDSRIAQHANGCKFRELWPNEPRLSEPPADLEEGEFTVGNPDDLPDFDDLPTAQEERDAADPDGAFLKQVQMRLSGAAQNDRTPPDERLVKHMRGAVSNLFGSDNDARLRFLAWAYGVKSSNELSAGMCRGIIDFIGSTKIGDEWVPGDAAIAFLRVFRRAVMGQQELL